MVRSHQDPLFKQPRSLVYSEDRAISLPTGAGQLARRISKEISTYEGGYPTRSSLVVFDKRVNVAPLVKDQKHPAERATAGL